MNITTSESKKEFRLLDPAADIKGKNPIVIEGVRNITDDQYYSQIEANLDRNLPEIATIPPHKGKMLIAASGPSLMENIDLLRRLNEFPEAHITATKSSHDYLISQGIIPRFCQFLDGRDHSAGMFTPHDDVVYLVASMCHPNLFDKLKDNKVFVYHAISAGNNKKAHIEKRRPNAAWVFGGCTTPLRAMPLGFLIGFRFFVFFGLDSCYTEKKVHEYLDSVQSDGLTREVEVICAGRKFITTPQMMGQIQDFGVIMKRKPKNVEVYLVGDGLINWRDKNRDENGLMPYLELTQEQIERDIRDGYVIDLK